jgi:hypothetical protein
MEFDKFIEIDPWHDSRKIFALRRCGKEQSIASTKANNRSRKELWESVLTGSPRSGRGIMVDALSSEQYAGYRERRPLSFSMVERKSCVAGELDERHCISNTLSTSKSPPGEN